MTDWHETILQHIESRSARVVIVGLGYVGLPLALAAVDAGFDVTGVEVDAERLEALSRSESYVDDVDRDDLERAGVGGRWHLAPDYEVVASAEVVVVCVPTPLIAGVPDLSSVLSAADAIKKHMKEGTLVSLESTTYPGTTEEVFRPRLEHPGMTAGENFALVFSPERIDPGNPRYGFGDIPKLVGGLTARCTQLGVAFYSALVEKVVPVGRPREAEMAKLLENTYRQVNIALINEFAMVAHELDIDIWEVVEAAATKPFGFQPFYPGIGIGGHCIAVDPVYLTWRIRELGRAPFRLVELAQEVDQAMPTYIANRVGEALLADGLSIRGAKVFALGVTYKPDVADLRTSRALDVLEKLAESGAELSYHDPFHGSIEVGGNPLPVGDLETELADCDIAVILTHHSTYDWNDVVARAPRVFDSRGVTRAMDDPKIVRL